MRYSLLFAFVGLLFSATLTFAQETPSSTPSATQPRKAIIQERRESAQNAEKETSDFRTDIKQRFKQRLRAFKDKVKAERVSRIDTILSSVNEKRTSAMKERLERMEGILTDLEIHIQKLAKDGKDTAAATQTVQDAKKAIASAKTAVETQTLKDYTITINSEISVKTDAAKARENLYTDLQLTHTQVVEARQKVAEAISTTRSLIGEKHGQ